MVSKAALGVGQRKLEELAALPGVSELTLIVPPYWKEPRVGRTSLEKLYTKGYRLLVEPMALNGNFHLHFFPGLAKRLKQLRPDIVHLDEESFNLATTQGVWLAHRYGAKAVFSNWANIYRDYPLPFSYFEKYNFKQASGATAGNDEARAILRRRGFGKPIVVCPQFGVDLNVTCRTTPPPGFARPDLFTIGYAGRLVPEKGLDILLEAAAKLKGDFRVVLIGSGSIKAELEHLANQLGLAAKVEFIPAVSSQQIASYMSGMDAFVLPSLTKPNWKEQFGRVLIEAMACQTPVIGSSSGEIPYVIGNAGLIFPEGDGQSLAAHLQSLLDSPDLRTALAERGLARVKANYTQAQVAQRHFELYQLALNN
jgi:glycosyltransferase involved in cell wall biosynthesis